MDFETGLQLAVKSGWNWIGDHGIVVKPQAMEFRPSLEYLLEDNLQRTIIDLSEEPEIVEEFMQALKSCQYTGRAVSQPVARRLTSTCGKTPQLTLLSPTWFGRVCASGI